MFARMTTARRSSTLRAAVACPNALTSIVDAPKHVEQPETPTTKWYGLGGSRQDFVLTEAVTS